MSQTTNPATNNNAPQTRKEFKGKGDAAQKLNLSASQKQQLKTINQDIKQQMQALKASGKSADAKQKRQALLKDHQQKIDNILTPEQRTQFDEMKKNHQKGKRGFGANGTAANHKMGRLSKTLNLTPDQQAKAKALHQSFKSNVEDIQKNTSLTNDQKQQQVKELKKKHKEEFQSMLTTEQKGKLKKPHEKPSV